MMRRISVWTCLLIISLPSVGQEYAYPYAFFTNSLMTRDYFFSSVSASGGSSIGNLSGKIPVNRNSFHTPGNSLALSYRNAPEGRWRAIVYRKEIRGIDHFKPANALSFWVYRSFNKIGMKELPRVQLMRRDSSLTQGVQMRKIAGGKWQRVLIRTNELDSFYSKQLTDYIAVVFSQEGGRERDRHMLYIDDIEMVTAEDSPALTSAPVITSVSDKYAAHIDITWQKVTDKNIRFVKIYRSTDDRHFSLAGVQEIHTNRFADFLGQVGEKYFYALSFLNHDYEEGPRSSSVAGATRAMIDEDLLTMVQEAACRYYWEAAEPISGLAKENIPGRQNMIATGASGFGIMALIAGTERKFITREESVARFNKILDFLQRADRFHGVYPHFIDGPSGKVEPFFGKRDNGADLVETSFLLQGLLAARQYFSGVAPQEKAIRDKITLIWEQAEWDWFRQRPDSRFLYWHWSPDQGWIINHPLIGWNETMVTYLLAIASPTHPVPPAMYYSGWANQDSTGIKYRSAWGQTKEGSHYTNGNTYFGIKLDVGVSTGGPLFFTHYSFMGYDPHSLTDRYTNYFVNNQNIARINHRYCVENPNGYKGYGDSAWGLTASDGPFSYSADEPVVWQDHGKIAPTGAISSFPYTPVESMKALKNYYFNYGSFLWGEYGFRDAFDLGRNWCSDIYMGLNQAPMVVMIENYRTGLLWKLFMSNKDIRDGLGKLEAEK